MGERVMQAKSLFLSAIERAPEEWPTFLNQACAGYLPPRAEVERLLRAQAALGSFHEASRSSSTETVDHPSRERPGVAIGPYKLLQQIGEGGMGVVYVAEQEQPVRRLVALKIIKPGSDPDSLYRAARMRAVTAAVLRAVNESATSNQTADAEADRAMAWLTQAIASGFKKAAHMLRDTDLDALRDRTDFAKLVTTREGIRD
jgi:hypothetical protein